MGSCDAYRYVSEAYGGYHINALHGINVDAGIFMSYIGLFSYYNFDNWAYQPSYVSSNTPWFFNGVRVQIFPNGTVEDRALVHQRMAGLWLGQWRPGPGGQIKWTPAPWINIISNNYGVGQDDLSSRDPSPAYRCSIEVKYYDHPENTLDKMAFSVTGDLGCEYGAGVNCSTNKRVGPSRFLGYMGYNRFWFNRDLFPVTVGGQHQQSGTLSGADSAHQWRDCHHGRHKSPYFTENPGDPFKAWDTYITFDYMPKQYITFARSTAIAMRMYPT